MKKIITKAMVGALAAGFVGTGSAYGVTCGQVITGNETLTGNLFCILNDPVITIDGGSLDMNGYQIGCLPGQDGVAFINSGGKLRNGSIEGCDRAAVLAGSGKHTVVNVHAKGGSDTGFYMLGSGNKMIKNVASGFGNYGFRAATALPPLSDVFIDNVSANNGDSGFHIDGDKAKMSGNVAVGNGGRGIWIDGEGNKLMRNIAYDNVQSGVQVEGSANSVQKNVSVANGTGVVVLSGLTKVKSNVAIASVGNGYSNLEDGSLFSGNSSILNGTFGFVMLGNNVGVSKSSAILNGSFGIWMGMYTGVVAKGNRLFSNGDVGLYSAGNGAEISGNLGFDNVNADADDFSATCSTNIWDGNVFGSAADSCIQ